MSSQITKALCAITILLISWPSARSQSNTPSKSRHFAVVNAKITRKNPGTNQKAPPSDTSTSVQYSYATWLDELRAGDCGQKNGTLTVGSDGTLHWDVVNYTYHTHSGDIWHVGFTLLDINGLNIGDTLIHDSPRMNDGNGGPPPPYHWSFDDHYDPSVYNQIWDVQESSSC